MKPTRTIRVSLCRFPLLSTCVIFFLACSAGRVSGGPKYPSDFAIDHDNLLLFTANKESRSLSVIEIKTGELIQELLLGPGSRPARVLPYRRQGKLEVALSDNGTHCVRIFSARVGTTAPLRLAKVIQTGRDPAGLAYDPDTGVLFVACSEEGKIWVVDPGKGISTASIQTIEGAQNIRFAGDDGEGHKGLLVISGRQEIGLVDTRKRIALGSTSLSLGRGLNISGFTSSRGNIFVSHQIQPTQVAVDPQMIVWGLILSNRITRIPVATLTKNPILPRPRQSIPGYEKVYGVKFEGGDPRHSVFPLDQRQRANGDPGRPAIVRSDRTGGDLLLLPVGGTNRVLFIDTEDAYLAGTEPLSRLEAIPSINVGDRPVSVITDSAGKRAYVLCSLEDSIWEIEIETRKVMRKIRLGPPPAHTKKHLGARIFYDSRRSTGGWYSCHSCHPEGGSRGHVFDTQADGDGLSKKAPDLHGVALSSPWSWNGRFKSLPEQVEASLHSTMAVNHPPPPEDVLNLVAFLRSLEYDASETADHEHAESTVRGKILFKTAGCANCHKPPLFTSPDLKDVGVFDDYDGFRNYNPPGLLRVRSRHRYLHDGRADTLRSIFTEHNPEKKHGKAHVLTPGELDDLVAYLKTL